MLHIGALPRRQRPARRVERHVPASARQRIGDRAWRSASAAWCTSPTSSAAPDVPAPLRGIGCKPRGIKSIVFAPMLWEGRGVGAIRSSAAIRRSPFTDKELALLKTFADQAVIAIQNARLFSEIQAKSRELEIANRHKSEFLANMSHELRTPLNAIIGFTRIVDALFAARLKPKQLEYLDDILTSGQHLLALINDDPRPVEGRGRPRRGASRRGARSRRCSSSACAPSSRWSRMPRLVKEFDGGLPQMYVDEEKLRQIVHQPAQQRRQVHRSAAAIRLQAHAANGVGGDRGRRHRHRHPARQARADLRGVRAGRREQHARSRRHRARARHRPAPRAPDGRRHRRAESVLGRGSTFTPDAPAALRQAPA